MEIGGGTRGTSSNAWKTTLCPFTSDPLIFISTLLLPPTTYYLISEAIDDTPATLFQAFFGGYCCCYGFRIRTRLRNKYNLQGSLGADLMSHCLCHCFALARNYLEAKLWQEVQRSPPNDPANALPFPSQVHNIVQGWQQGGSTIGQPVVQQRSEGQGEGREQNGDDEGSSNSEDALRQRLEGLKAVRDQQQGPISKSDELPDQPSHRSSLVPRSGDSVSSHERQERIDIMLTDEDAIDEMKNQLAEDFATEDPVTTSDIPEAVIGALPQPLPAVPAQLTERPPYEATPNTYLSMPGSHPGVATMQPGQDFGSGMDTPGVQPPASVYGVNGGSTDGYNSTVTGVPEVQTFGVSPVVAPPEYPGPLHYGNSQGSGTYFSAENSR